MKDEQNSKLIDLAIKALDVILTLSGLVNIVIDVFNRELGTRFLWGLSLLMMAVLVILVGALRKKNCESEENEDFLAFLHFLFNHRHGNSDGFTLLPRMCLQIDREKIVNPIHIKKLKMTLGADMTEWDDRDDLSAETKIYYEDSQTFELTVENRNLPKQYFCCMVNAYSEKPTEFIQWHGNQNAERQDVNVDREINKMGKKSQIGIYDWELEKRFITGEDTIPINFKVKYISKECASSSTIVVIYPKRYGEKIDNIEVNINYLSKKIRVENVTAYHIGKKSNGNFGLFSIPVTKQFTEQKKSATVEISAPKCRRTDAYYIQVDWTLIDKKPDT